MNNKFQQNFKNKIKNNIKHKTKVSYLFQTVAARS